MGTQPVKLENVTVRNGKVIVHGQNFTPYCKVIFDGKELESKWLDEHRIELKEIPERSERKLDKNKSYEPDKLPNTFVVEVQNGDSVKLSCSNPVRFKDTSLAEDVQ